MKFGEDISKVHIVVPCFNEVERFDFNYWNEILRIPGISLLFVDDGSSDHTFKVFKQLNLFENCEVVQTPENVGKANAIRFGMQHLLRQSGINSIGFLDADGAFSVSDVARYLHIWKNQILKDGYSTLWSSRVELSGRKIARNKFRHYVGRILLTYIMFRNEFIAYDTQSGFKIYLVNDGVMESIKKPFETRWYFDLEFYLRILQYEPEYKIYEEPLTSWRDVSGSKVGSRQYFSILWQTYKVRKMLTVHQRLHFR